MKYDTQKYKVWGIKNISIIHWILNPGIAFNELVLGQMIPKVMLIERAGDKSFVERSLVPCPHCHTMHAGLKWSHRNKTAFKNWFGLYCDSCGEIIPVHRNLTSLLILGITYPIWGWFREPMRQKWLEKQPARYQNLSLEVPKDANSTKNWLKSGLVWGAFMFVLMGLIFPLLFKDQGITPKSLAINAIIWPICGLLWGLTMKAWMGKKGWAEVES